MRMTSMRADANGLHGTILLNWKTKMAAEVWLELFQYGSKEYC